jgi:small multidrug resistance pump
MAYVYLAIAIVSEVIATNALKASDGFTRLGPSTIVVVGYALAFYFLALVLRTLPVGVAYAIWAGAGIALVALVAAVAFRQIPDLPALIGMGLIVAGVVVITVFSKTAGH